MHYVARNLQRPAIRGDHQCPGNAGMSNPMNLKTLVVNARYRERRLRARPTNLLESRFEARTSNPCDIHRRTDLLPLRENRNFWLSFPASNQECHRSIVITIGHRRSGRSCLSDHVRACVWNQSSGKSVRVELTLRSAFISKANGIPRSFQDEAFGSRSAVQKCSLHRMWGRSSHSRVASNEFAIIWRLR